MLNGPYLVFVQLAVFVLLLSLFLEGDDDEAHKYIHHEKGDQDEVDDKENWDGNSVVVRGPLILHVWIDGFVKDPEWNKNKPKVQTDRQTDRPHKHTHPFKERKIGRFISVVRNS